MDVNRMKSSEKTFVFFYGAERKRRKKVCAAILYSVTGNTFMENRNNFCFPSNLLDLLLSLQATTRVCDAECDTCEALLIHFMYDVSNIWIGPCPLWSRRRSWSRQEEDEFEKSMLEKSNRRGMMKTDEGSWSKMEIGFYVNGRRQEKAMSCWVEAAVHSWRAAKKNYTDWISSIKAE